MASAAEKTRVLKIERVFDAPVDLVWRCWTEKQHLDKWSAPKGYTIPKSQGDTRVGGKYHLVMRTPDGHDLGLGGVYREIVPHKKLVMTHVWDEDGIETVVTVRFEDMGKRTKMIFEQSGFTSDDSMNGHEGGWTECFDILDELLAAMHA
jgi:uncharacterized protein YndB with AHSA1/START domain